MACDKIPIAEGDEFVNVSYRDLLAFVLISAPFLGCESARSSVFRGGSTQPSLLQGERAEIPHLGARKVRPFPSGCFGGLLHQWLQKRDRLPRTVKKRVDAPSRASTACKVEVRRYVVIVMVPRSEKSVAIFFPTG